MNKYADFMNGEPALQVFGDAYCRGLVPADVLGTIYDSARAFATDPAKHRNPEFMSLGYTTGEAAGGLEHASADFALALVADAKGDTATRDTLLGLSDNWRNILDPDSKFMRPRDANRNWYTTGDGVYHPEFPDRWREGTGWQYTWLVSHDAGGLFQAMGPATAEQRLDTFFAGATAPFAGPEAQQKLTLYGIAYYGNQYAPSNEHDLQAPWMYNWTDSPWKTQALQRSLQTIYRAVPDGLPGNDDLGTMSAWFVWSALGFYPMTPGSPTLTIGSPLFEQARIRLSGGEFTVDAPGASHAQKFITKTTLDDAELGSSFFRASAIAPNKSIEFEMSGAPNVLASLGKPPSQSTNADLSDFACAP